MVRLEWSPPWPLDFSRSIARYVRWGVDPANVVSDGAFHRVIDVDGSTFAYRATQLQDGTMAVEAPGEDLAEAARRDLEWRLAGALPRDPVDQLAANDDRVAALVEQYPGFRPPMVADPFESLVTSISAQQVNLKWATTTRRRLIERYGAPFDLDGVGVWQFPSAAALADSPPDAVRALQYTTRKAEYIVGVARVAADGGLRDLADLSNEAVIDRLVRIRGIGRWSADWLLARCLARPDVVAAGDLGVRKAVSFAYYANEDILSEEAVRTTAERWGDAANWTAHMLLETLTS